MTVHIVLIVGKILETIGAALLAYVALHALFIELIFARIIHSAPSTNNSENTDLGKVAKGLEIILEKRRRQFGYWEALIVGAGTTLICIGCIIYLVALLKE